MKCKCGRYTRSAEVCSPCQNKEYNKTPQSREYRRKYQREYQKIYRKKRHTNLLNNKTLNN